MVDAVGGVQLCVDEETTSIHIGWDATGKETSPYRLIPPDFHPVPIAGVRPQVYHVGCQPMAGWQALDYVRQRDLIPDGDYGRHFRGRGRLGHTHHAARTLRARMQLTNHYADGMHQEFTLTG